MKKLLIAILYCSTILIGDDFINLSNKLKNEYPKEQLQEVFNSIAKSSNGKCIYIPLPYVNQNKQLNKSNEKIFGCFINTNIELAQILYYSNSKEVLF